MQRGSCGWTPDETSGECQQCAQKFHFFSRRHHCRCCGGLFCGCCSGSFIPLELLRKLSLAREMNPLQPTAASRAQEKRRESERQQKWEEEEDALEYSDKPSFFFLLIRTLMAKLSALQRVCQKCHWKARKLLSPFSEASDDASTPSTESVSPPVKCALPGSGRERKIYVISLRGKSLLDKRDYVGLPAVFEELDKLIVEGSESLHRVDNEGATDRSQSTAFNPSQSNDSISTLYSSERSTFEAALCFDEAGAHRWKRRRGITHLEDSPRKSCHRVVLHVPVLIPESEGGTVCNTRVRIQLVGLTHQQSFNRELLQQETIGTDAYVILPDGELSPVPRCGGVSPEGGVCRDLVASSSTARNLCDPSEVPKAGQFLVANPTWWVVPRLSRGFDWSPHSTSMDGVRYVWETIEQFGGAKPICAVIDYTPCDREEGSRLESPVSAGVHKCRSDGAYTLGNGPIYVHCHKGERERYPSVKEQASALHRALLLVAGEVIVRDWLQHGD